MTGRSAKCRRTWARGILATALILLLCGAGGFPARTYGAEQTPTAREREEERRDELDAGVDSALGHVRLLNDCNFDDICISVKCSHVPVNMAAYRMLHEQTHYPLHLGVTEAGTPRLGVLKSAIGIGGLLCQGIGDTLRVSLTADPEEEVRAALDILSAAGLRKTGPDLISCPTCGRTKYDMIPIAREVERRLQGCTKPITVAVMGCVVNGPGEARAADVGIAGGDGEGLLFRHGEILRKVPQDKLVDALMDEIDKL